MAANEANPTTPTPNHDFIFITYNDDQNGWHHDKTTQRIVRLALRNRYLSYPSRYLRLIQRYEGWGVILTEFWSINSLAMNMEGDWIGYILADDATLHAQLALTTLTLDVDSPDKTSYL
ncbi:hypothetical protein LTR09_008734 [Extremus antarcticus]|uniref:Uncharacterized protein n=1 Tax=Extremus antarcticus TaxID=702011 RepID=A0AAJ0DH16_9PEZI|nr:hypothetical protein LTR09_008734 [Extremus antarcticus]